jgi:hypothetical protein
MKDKIKRRKSIKVMICFIGHTYNGLSKKQHHRIVEIRNKIRSLIREQNKIIKKGWKK